ncbi:hypothetical protein [Streptomyces cyaneus]|uniref:hypothetical protein n=1 Tax=Streptomyces cyaneus TaxID=1904 RepID=UPI000FF8AF9D|nr:hypothetical protein [Streptomyces cyaneus]
MSAPSPVCNHRVFVVVIVALLSVIAGIIVGILMSAGGAGLPTALIAGGGGFVSSVTVSLLITNAVGLT